MKQRGFTLIELSIVLVILGLIVGAIVGGKSLIRAANTQSIIRDYQGYLTAYNAFVAQYDAKPGDMVDGWSYFGGGVDTICGMDNDGIHGCNGNGNGIIGGHSDENSGYSEMTRAWMHLQLAEIIPPKVTYAGRYDFVYPSLRAGDWWNSVPQAKNAYGDAGWNFYNNMAYLTWWPSGNTYGKPGAWLALGASFSAWDLYNAAFDSRDAAAIDKKLDDGLPVAGNVAAENSENANGACRSGGGGYVQEVADPTQTYELASAGPSCHMYLFVAD